jgi:4,5-dihydroxyphthalate decarboxylase
MAQLKLSLACGPYDLMSGLIDGTAATPGLDLTVLTMASPERHRRMLRNEEFDVCELSLGGYLIAREAGKAFTAIPVFPHRRFRHGYVAINTRCGIAKPADLNGKRIGLRTLRNSAGLWMRGILQDHYGVELKSIEWWCQEEEDLAIEPAAWMKVRRVAQGRNIDEMLVAGELHAAIYPEMLPSLRSKSPEVGLLFPDPKAAEIDYFRKTGIFPIMHTVVIKNEIVERNPWVAVSVLQAFQNAKELCYRRMRNPRVLALVWAEEHMKEQQAVFGNDPWPYNLEDNRANLEVAVRYAHNEGMIKTQPKLETLFVPSSLQQIGHYLE